MGSASSHVTRRDGQRVPRQTDPGLRHNSTLKMAQKSAYICATLAATAASEFFTQDMEDVETAEPETTEPETAERGLCPVHNVAFQHRQGVSKTGKPYDFWACPERPDGDYCKERPQDRAEGPPGRGESQVEDAPGRKETSPSAQADASPPRQEEQTSQWITPSRQRAPTRGELAAEFLGLVKKLGWTPDYTSSFIGQQGHPGKRLDQLQNAEVTVLIVRLKALTAKARPDEGKTGTDSPF